MGKRKIWQIAMIFSACLFCIAGCKKKKSEEVELSTLPVTEAVSEITPTTVPEVSIAPTPEIDTAHIGMAKSYLTGEWLPEETAKQRPFAVMINNITYANPQSGTGDASIIYEALVEGGITRLMAIFENVDPESKTAKRLGSVRSARHYYVSFADEYDAVFVHYGQTSYAIKKMKKLGIDTVSGMAGPGVNSFYRDNTIKRPHNAFLSLEGYQKAIQKAGYRTTYQDGYEPHYTFYDEDTKITGDSAKNVTIRFSQTYKPILNYDETSGLYLRNQFGDKHIDYNTKEQLEFKNIIVQFVKEWDIDSHGYQTMDIEDASGDGYYITNGNATKITWKKNESKRFMRYYDADGNELTINPGKTYIAVFPNSRVKDVVLE